MARSKVSARELAAARMMMVLVQGPLMVREAGRILADAQGSHWDRMAIDTQEKCCSRAIGLLRRISEPPDGIPLFESSVWELADVHE